MGAEDPDNLDLRAFLALQGATLDWRKDLAELMRSDVPISRLLRDRLADAFENQGNEGPRLDLNNHKGSRDRFAGVVSRHQWMEIGRWVAVERERGATVRLAIERGEQRFCVGEKAIEKALTYYKRATLWVDKAMISDAGQSMGRKVVESLYHSITVQPEMKKINADLIRTLGLSH